MLDYEITKRIKLKEVNNDMTHNYYYLIMGKMYNEYRNRYRNFRYAAWFDIFDLQEYFEKDIINKKDIREYLEMILDNVISSISGIDYNNDDTIEKFYNICDNSIYNFIYNK